MTERPLREHQERALEALRASYASGHHRPVLQLPTGAGKTRVAAEIIKSGLARYPGRRIVFCVPALALIDQTAEAFWAEDVRDIGVIQANNAMTNPHRMVQIASVQTLARRTLPDAGLVIVDECHRASKAIEAWMASQPELPFIGLSATPWARGMGLWYDDLIIAATTSELIEAGFLAPFRVFAASHPDLSGVATVAGDYKEDQLSAVMSAAPLVGDVVRTWLERAPQLPTLVFAVDRAHAYHLQTAFQAAGIAAEYQDANTTDDERRGIRKRFQGGQTRVVCNVGTLTTGVDWDVRCLVMARPTKSEMLYVQIIGRALRTAPGKAEALILDHSDNTLRLGFVTDISYPSLDDGKPKPKKKAETKDGEALPKECPECHNLRPPRVLACVVCGHIEAPQHVAGELVEAKTSMLRHAGMARLPGGVHVAKRDLYAQLKWHAGLRGYKPSWAAMQYKAATGEWPGGLLNTLPPQQVSPEVRRWITSQLRAYATSRKSA